MTRHLPLQLALVLCLAACQSQPLRNVVDVVPRSVRYQIEVRASAAPPRGVDPGTPEEAAEFGLGRSQWTAVPGPSLTREGIPGAALPQAVPTLVEVGLLDTSKGPIDLGYSLLLDLGAGEAPYDDGVATIHGVELTRSGFSDSVLQASWRERWADASMIHATAAVSRYQDLGLMDGLSDMRFTFFVIGWSTSF